jgi:hypothetical protein
MSLLTACTEASPGVSYFAPASGGGGGGGGSTLQSPALITPSVSGQALLSIIQSTGSTLPAAGLIVQSTNGNDATVTLGCNGGGNTYFSMGTANSVNLIVSGLAPTLMNITDVNDVVTMSIDVGSQTTTIGTAAAGIVVSPAQTTVTGNYKYLSSFVSPVNSGSVNAITNPTQTGLYAILIRSSDATVQAQQACIGTIGYYLSGTGWLSGNAYVILNADPTQFAQIFLNTNTLYFKYVSAVQAQLSSVSAQVIQIAGNLNI